MKRGILYASLIAIVTLAGALPSAQIQTNGGAADPASLPTPRTADGKPDLSGAWTAGGGGGGGGRPIVELEEGKFAEEFPSRRCGPTQVKCGDYTNQSEDGEFTARMD